MQRATVGLDLFNLLQKFKRKHSKIILRPPEGIKAPKGILFGLLFGLAFWSIIITFSIVIF